MTLPKEPQDLIQTIKDFQPHLSAALKTMVVHESPSTDKASLDELANLLENRFRSAGARVEMLAERSHGNNVLAAFPSISHPDAPLGLVLCHYDTVWPLGTLAKQPFEIRDGRAYGPGVYDMKASIAMVETALQAIQSLGEDLPRPLLVLLTSDEEIGSPSSRPHIERLASKSAYVLVIEPPSFKGALKTSRKGVGRFIVEVNGRASHAGTQPEKGISATHELAHQILRLEKLNDPEKGTTVNVGIVHGGTRRNVVAARAVAEVDVRAWTQEEATRLTAAIQGLRPVHPGAVLKIRGGFGRPPMERSEATVNLFRKAQKIGRALGLELGESASGGGSDANFTAALGVPTLDGLGAIGDGAHADDEHILLEPLPMRTALLAELLLNF